MIVVTGGAGFIGYNLVRQLLALGHENIVVIDNNIDRWTPITEKIFNISVEDSYLWLQFNGPAVEYVFHLGARTDTMEKDVEIFKRLNFNYSKFIWDFCVEEGIPFIYASSAAVYGDGTLGFNDEKWEWYQPLNPYGVSKFQFDTWIQNQVDDGYETPPFWAGLRFFNVYGPFEDHKGKMASVIWHIYHQIKKTGGVKLFKSHREDVEHGEQKRDFIHVNDISNVMLWLSMGKHPSGIYNLGTGTARSYNDLAEAIFKSLGKESNISYIDTPIEIRNSYQYFTEADMEKLRGIGYEEDFTSLEEGIDLYIKYLEDENSKHHL